MTDIFFSRQQLGRLANVPDDALSFWLKRGLLRNAKEGSGRGIHRRFDRSEVKLAAFLGEARQAGLNIGALDALAEKVREGVALYRQIAPPRRWAVDVWSLATDLKFGTRDPLETVRYHVEHGHMTEDESAEVRRAVANLADVDHDAYLLGFEFEDCEGIWAAYVDAGLWVLDRAPGTDSGLPARAVLMFDMKKILAIDWDADVGRASQKREAE